MDATEGFVEAVLASPLGVSWLAVLETGSSGEFGWPATAPIADERSVSAAVDRVEQISFGDLVSAAVHASVIESGPWMPAAPDKIAAAYRQSERRAPIAEAVAKRFGERLHAPIDLDRQQWFTDGSPEIDLIAPLFESSFDDVYAAGEFPIAGLWTATEPPPEALPEMIGAWELETGPIARWGLPAQPSACVVEIHRPSDWAQLTASHPMIAHPHPGWELPGVNQHVSDVAPLAESPVQNAVRRSVGHHVVPDWRSVAEHYDAIHLSWAGFITSEGFVSDLGDGDVAMLRYWFSERTLWLADVFDEPVLEPDPNINFASSDRSRQTVTPELFHRLLGRSHDR